MQERFVFVIGPPRSGSTMLQRMLGSHPAVATHPEPHIVTPLAHLGYYANVDKAPYDHINAAEAQRAFVDDLPRGEDDYLDACRAYTDVLYGRMLEQSGKQLFVDKTPANALVLPFLTRLYPHARYVVLTRHPLAVLCSYANSFFEGDFDRAVGFNDILGRYVPAMAELLRRGDIDFHHVCYEDLVRDPDRHMQDIFSYLGVPHRPDAIEYGRHRHQDKGYGDPKVRHRDRPTTASVESWAEVLASDEHKLEAARQVIARLDPDDVRIWGYDPDGLFDPVAAAGGTPPSRDWRWMTDSYRLKRKVFLGLRKGVRHNSLGGVLRRVRYYCDVLLRE